MLLRALVLAVASLAGVAIAGPLAADPPVHRAGGRVTKKSVDAPEPLVAQTRPRAARPVARMLLATLVQTHTDERVMLDEETPGERFDRLLADRVTGSHHELDPRLLDLLRQLAAKWPGARIELVSGYRSPKLNEMMRKKGHHVASHSQHSLGHAVDFRVVPDGVGPGLDPRELERAIRDAGWRGGVGTYRLKWDWFVHADVGPQRSWRG